MKIRIALLLAMIGLILGFTFIEREEDTPNSGYEDKSGSGCVYMYEAYKQGTMTIEQFHEAGC